MGDKETPGSVEIRVMVLRERERERGETQMHLVPQVNDVFSCVFVVWQLSLWNHS